MRPSWPRCIHYSISRTSLGAVVSLSVQKICYGLEDRGVRIPGRSKESKSHPITGHEGPEVKQRYSSTPSLTSVLDGGGWWTPRSGRFTPGKDPLYRRLGGPQGRSGRGRGKESSPKCLDQHWSPFNLLFNEQWGYFAGREVNHSPSPSAAVKFEWSDTSIPPIRLHGVDKDNFTFSGGRSLNY
jgi:hypothetical protein